MSIYYRPGSILAVISTVLNKFIELMNKNVTKIMITAKRKQNRVIKSDRIESDVGLSRVVT